MQENIQVRSLLSMWVKPRETVRKIINSGETGFILLLAALGGIVGSLSNAAGRGTADNLTVPVIFILAIIIGSISGILGLYISSALIRWTGRWLGGKADFDAIRTAVAWPNVTAIASLLLWIPQLMIFGEEIFQTEMPSLASNPALLAPFFLFLALEIILTIWTVVLMIKAVAEVQGFSAWKSLGNLVLSTLVIAVPILIIIGLIVMII